MEWEIFTRKVRRLGPPSVSLTKMGRLQLNKTATSKLEKEAVENVLLLWNAPTNTVGIRSITKKDSRAYRVSYGAKGNGAGFSAKTFFDHIGLDYSDTRTIPVDFGEGDVLLMFRIPDEYFAKRRQQHLVLETATTKKGRTA